MAHTPGPWEWDAELPTCYDEGFYRDNAPWLVGVHENILTGQIACPNPANKHLISAAPELLEAAREAYVVMAGEQGSNDPFDAERWSKAVIGIKAVIAKAEGR